MGIHNHNHCHHDLKYCEVCDVVYCTKCSWEWGRRFVADWTYVPGRITWGTSGTSTTIDIEANVHNHE